MPYGKGTYGSKKGRPPVKGKKKTPKKDKKIELSKRKYKKKNPSKRM